MNLGFESSDILKGYKTKEIKSLNSAKFESSDILKGYKTFILRIIVPQEFESSDILKGYKTTEDNIKEIAKV